MRRAQASLFLALALAAPGAIVAPGVALADRDPVAERASITYRLDRDAGRVDARAAVRFTNRIPVQRVGDRVRRYYLDRWGPIAISSDAQRVKVRPRSVRVQRIATGGAYDTLVFTFPRIFNGGSVSFTLTWTVPGQGDGSTTGTVVSDAYSHFCWPGQPVDSGPISLVVPRDLEVVTQGGPVRTSSEGSRRRVTARGDLARFYACTDVYDPSLLVGRDLVSSRGHAVRVESLPGHEGWLETTSQDVATALAGVEDVVGAPLPGDEPIKVREVPSSALQGYAGDFDPRSGVVRVGDQGASVALLSHELSHAWFNTDTVSANWLWEGLAEWVSREIIGAPCGRPVEWPLTGRPRLRDWKVLQAGGVSFEDQQVVQWQYEAACAIQGRVAAAIGPDRMRDAIALLLSGDSPYDLLPAVLGQASLEPTTGIGLTPSVSPTPSAPPRQPPGAWAPSPDPDASPSPPVSPVPPLVSDATNLSTTPSSTRRTRPVDWRQWLDIVDEAGLVPAGIEDLAFAQDLLVETGVIRRRDVRDRAETRAAFHSLRARAVSGVTPAVVRRELDRWDFDAAMRDIRLADAVVSRIAALPATSPDLAGLWAAYERAASHRALERLRDRLP